MENSLYIFMKTDKKKMVCKNEKFIFDIGHITRDYVKKGGYTQKTLHKHGYYELHMVTAGECEFEIEKGKRLKVKKGQFIIFPPECRHRIVMESEDFEKFGMSYILTVVNNDEAEFFILANTLLENIKVYKYSKSIKLMEERIVALFNEKSYEYKTSMLYTALNMIIDMLNITTGSLKISEKETHNDERVNRAVKYINDNIHMNITVAEVADNIHISPKQLTRIFKEAKEMTPGSYIKTRRLEKIRELMINLDLSLEEISEIMNFNDVSSLVKLYKRAEGITPGKSRAMLYKG